MWSTRDRMGKRKPTKHSVGIYMMRLIGQQPNTSSNDNVCILESWSWNVMNCGPRFRHFSQPWFFTLGKRNKNPLPAIFEQVFVSCGSHWDTFFSTFSEGWTIWPCYAYAMPWNPTKMAMFSAPSGIEFKDVDPQADQFNGGLDGGLHRGIRFFTYPINGRYVNVPYFWPYEIVGISPEL